MKKYTRETITDFGESITQSVATPAKKDLLEMDETSGELTRKDEEMSLSRNNPIVIRVLLTPCCRLTL